MAIIELANAASAVSAVSAGTTLIGGGNAWGSPRGRWICVFDVAPSQALQGAITQGR